MIKGLKPKQLLIGAIVLFVLIIATPLIFSGDFAGWGIKSLSCSDEKGVDYYTPDKITIEYIKSGIQSRDYSDFCVDNKVIEYTCSADNKLKKVEYTCPHGCLNGACEYSLCTDSDGGKDYYTEGVVVFEGKVEETSMDYCLNAKTLNEYFCASQEEIRAVEYVCPQGCKNGVCLGYEGTIGCEDTDRGVDYHTRGSITTSNGVQTDYCIGVKLAEYYCTNNGLAMVEFYQCPNGCFNGACAS